MCALSGCVMCGDIFSLSFSTEWIYLITISLLCNIPTTWPSMWYYVWYAVDFTHHQYKFSFRWLRHDFFFIPTVCCCVFVFSPISDNQILRSFCCALNFFTWPRTCASFRVRCDFICWNFQPSRWRIFGFVRHDGKSTSDRHLVGFLHRFKQFTTYSSSKKPRTYIQPFRSIGTCKWSSGSWMVTRPTIEMRVWWS